MKSTVATLILALLTLAPALFAQNDVVARAMKDEMERSKTQLRLADMEKPYYIEYRVDEANTTSIQATLGVLTMNSTNRSRALSLQVRTGDYAFDNTNFLAVRSMGSRLGRLGRTQSLPLDDDYDQIRRDIWLATDNAYKQSASELAAKKSVLQTRKESVSLPDFTPQSAVTMVESARPIKFDRAALETLARNVSAAFRGTPEIIDSEVTLVVRDFYTRYLSSEGTFFTRSEPLVVIHVRANARAADGFPLEESFSVYSRDVDAIQPSNLAERAKKLAAGLVRLRDAGTLERYNGPVLFEGEAAGQVLADVFAPAISAARFPLTDEPRFESTITQMFGQMGGTPLTDKLGGRVMPEFLDVNDQPHLQAFEGTPLLGARAIDDEGVPARDVSIVSAGILKNLLATRTPTSEAKSSTGSKGTVGAVPSILVLTAKKSEPAAELRQHLLQLAKARGSDFGIVVRHAADGGLSWVAHLGGAMGAPGAPNNSDLEIYKLFADGREERLRGVEIGSLTPNAFRDIVAVGDRPALYQGPHVPMMTAVFSGFGSGSFGTDLFAMGSFVAPSILFEEISLKKANVPSPNPPVVPSPLPSFTASK